MRLAAITAATVAALSTSAHATVVLDDNFDDLVGQPGGYTLGADWVDGNIYGGNWYANFLGYGLTEVINATNSRLDMAPCDVDTTCPTQDPPITTAAALVTTIEDYDSTIGNGLEVEARTRLVSQLRDTNPNAWESPWILWNVQQSNGLVTYANYFALKTNGWELGVITGNNGQIFLATGSTPVVTSSFKTVTIQQNDNVINVWVSGSQVDLNGAATGKSFTDTNSYLSNTGAVGLYTEDARVQFDDVLISQL